MYDRIYGTSLDVFDIQTSEYLGKAYFGLSNEAERKVLNLINLNEVPDNLLLTSVHFLPSSEHYIPPDPFALIRRHSIFNATAREGLSKIQVSIEIELKYDRTARCNLTKDPNYLESAQLNHIKILKMNSI